MTTSAYRPGALDFTPRGSVLPRRLEPLWEARLPYQPGRTRLASVGERLALIEPDEGIAEVGGERPTNERMQPWVFHALSLYTAGAGFSSEPVLVDSDAVVYRWAPGAAPRAVWRADAPASALAVVGLPNDDLLVRRERDGGGSMARLHGPSGRVRWERRGSSAILLPHDDVIFIEQTGANDAIACLDAHTGRERWVSQRVEGGLADFIGVVGPALWVTTRSGRVASLSVDDGGARSEIALENVRTPYGVLDERGVFHVCTGFDVQRVDLVGKGRLVKRVAFAPADGAAVRSVAFGRLALITTDGRLIYHDERGAVYVLPPDDAEHPRLLWQGASPVAMLGATGGRLYALDSSGTLRAFGEPS